MASGRHYSSSSSSSSSSSCFHGASLIKGRSRPLLLILAIIVAYYIFSILSSSSSSSSSPPHSISIHSLHDVAAVDYSFVASLDKFLATKSPPRLSNSRVHHDDASKLDDAKWKADTQRLHQQPTFPLSLPIRVYVYDMPNKFTIDLLSLFLNTYKDTSNLTSNGSPVHRLIEQHSVDYWLWADLIAPESERLLKDVVVRVDREEEADLFYIPFFTTISFFLLEKQQCKALYRVTL